MIVQRQVLQIKHNAQVLAEVEVVAHVDLYVGGESPVSAARNYSRALYEHMSNGYSCKCSATHHMVGVVRVHFVKLLQRAKLNQGLVVQARLVLNHLKRNVLAVLVVIHLKWSKG